MALGAPEDEDGFGPAGLGAGSTGTSGGPDSGSSIKAVSTSGAGSRSGGGLRAIGAAGRTGGGTYARGFFWNKHPLVESVAVSHRPPAATSRIWNVLSRIGNRRELELKGGSLALLAGERYSPIVQLDSPVCHGQTGSRSRASLWWNRAETVAQAGRNSGTGVGDLQGNRVSCCLSRVRG